MYYQNEKHDVGRNVRVGPNTKGTGKRGVPVAIALLGKTEDFPAVSDPQGKKPGRATNDKALRDLGRARKVRNYNKSE